MGAKKEEEEEKTEQGGGEEEGEAEEEQTLQGRVAESAIAHQMARSVRTVIDGKGGNVSARMEVLNLQLR